MTRIAVIDHGAGNLVSIAQGLARSGAAITIADRPDQLENANGVVLPGVGSTGAAMARLEQAGFVPSLRALRKPLLGICVGLQLFFESSEEDDTDCLGLIRGRVERLTKTPKLPHIGWNDVEVEREDHLFEGIGDGTPFYFVHSFAVTPTDESMIVGRTRYGRSFVVAVRDHNRVGVQFHPERSGPDGLRILANFVDEARESADAT